MLRAEASEDSTPLATIACGAPVGVLDSAIGARFVRAYVEGRVGFALAASIGAEDNPVCTGQTITRAAQVALVAALAMELTAHRDAFAEDSGPCRCPSDLARDGSTCGARSSFSKLGGIDPADCI